MQIKHKSQLRTHKSMKDSNSNISTEHLKENIKYASRIILVSAYYDINYVYQLLERGKLLRKVNSLTMIFAKPSQAAERDRLLELQKFLKQLKEGIPRGGATTDIRWPNDARFLHSKLYYFEKGKWKRTLIGSANLSRNGFEFNNELLIEIAGKNLEVNGYLDALLKSSVSVNDFTPKGKVGYTNFEALLRDGFLYFKPSRANSYTIAAFDEKTELGKHLLSIIGGDPLLFSEDQKIGSLNILKLLSINSRGVDDLEGENQQHRMRLAPYAIETCFGYWVPSKFRDDLEKKLDQASQQKLSQLEAISKALSNLDRDRVKGEVTEKYVKDVDRRLEKSGYRKLRGSEIDGLTDKVIKRFNYISKKLADENERRQLARPMHGTPVPEFWEDVYSRNEMVESFCEYVTWRLSANGNQPNIITKLKQAFSLDAEDSAEEVKNKIQYALEMSSANLRVWGED